MTPRIGCLGLGWIGRHRLQALAASGAADVTVVADADEAARAAALAIAPGARAVATLDELLDAPIDGLMIATPSAQHAPQTMRALDRGLAVFCQKPLARSRAETAAVVELARQRDRLLHVDLSYRYARAFDALVTAVHRGDIGAPRLLDLTFHNAYGPDKPWYYTRESAGGGCVMDLGIHLIDLALRVIGPARPRVLASQLFCGITPWTSAGDEVEDLAIVQLETAAGAAMRLTCSWRLPAGRDAVIDATVYGRDAALRAHNLAGSFYDFAADRLRRGGVDRLESPPDSWGGRAAVAWAVRLGRDRGYDPACETYVDLAHVIDDIYAAARGPERRPPASICSSVSAR